MLRLFFVRWDRPCCNLCICDPPFFEVQFAGDSPDAPQIATYGELYKLSSTLARGRGSPPPGQGSRGKVLLNLHRQP